MSIHINDERFTNDLLLHVFFFLALPDLAICQRICKKWNESLESNLFWHDKFVSYFHRNPCLNHKISYKATCKTSHTRNKFSLKLATGNEDAISSYIKNNLPENTYSNISIKFEKYAFSEIKTARRDACIITLEPSYSIFQKITDVTRWMIGDLSTQSVDRRILFNHIFYNEQSARSKLEIEKAFKAKQKIVLAVSTDIKNVKLEMLQ